MLFPDQFYKNWRWIWRLFRADMRVSLLSYTKSQKWCHHWISHLWKPIKRGITLYFKLNCSHLRQIFIRECQNPRWPPKSKMAAENFGFSRLEFLVWLISTTMQNIRLVPKCVTHADVSCRATCVDISDRSHAHSPRRNISVDSESDSCRETVKTRTNRFHWPQLVLSQSSKDWNISIGERCNKLDAIQMANRGILKQHTIFRPHTQNSWFIIWEENELLAWVTAVNNQKRSHVYIPTLNLINVYHG